MITLSHSSGCCSPPLCRIYTGRLESSGARERSWEKLRAPPFNGDISQSLLSAAKSTRNRDYKSACGLLYDLLMRNTDVLAFPPVALQRPESPTTVHEQTQVQNKTGGGCWPD